MKTTYLRLISLIAILGLTLSTIPASAGGVGVTAGLPSNGEIDSAASTGFATTTVAWTSSATYLTGATIQLVLSPVPSSTAITECPTGIAGQSTSIGGATYTFGSASSSGATFTLTGDASTQVIRLCVRVPVTNGGSLISSRNFSEAVVTTGATVDFGAAMFYVNGGNDVTITATVPATISFKITSPSDITIEQHTCSLGVLTTAAINSCQYRLKIATNAQSGFSASILANQNMGTGSATLTNVGDLAVTAGSEEYGINLATSTYGGRDPSTGVFSRPATAWHPIAQDWPIPTTATVFVSSTYPFYVSSTAAGTLATQLVTHKASIDGATNAGVYTQRVTYYVTGHF
ncbi:MAG: hypothetical protein WC766_05580 [Patescibacteria group bacterium]|jgi:hypothetical protein